MAKDINNTRGLEALTRMLFFKFAMIIIGLCAQSEARKRNWVKMVNDFFYWKKR